MPPIPERAATPDERLLVEWLLRNCAAQGTAEPLLPEVARLQVVGICGCGCPSVDFLPDAPGASVVAEAVGRSPEGIDLGLILWAREGHLAGLEAYNYGDSIPFSLPRLEDLTPTHRGGAA